MKGKKQPNKIIEKDDYAIILIETKKRDTPLECLIDQEDIDKVKTRRWYVHETSRGTFYVHTWANNTNLSLTRFLLNYDGKLCIDHKNRNTLDNRKSNLRIVTQAENSQNKFGIRMYATESGKYYVQITRYGKNYKKGPFKSLKVAIIVRERLKAKLDEQNDKLKKEYYMQKPERCVIPVNGKWRVTIFINGKNTRIGTFDTKEEAIKARDEAEKAINEKKIQTKLPAKNNKDKHLQEKLNSFYFSPVEI